MATSQTVPGSFQVDSVDSSERTGGELYLEHLKNHEGIGSSRETRPEIWSW